MLGSTTYMTYVYVKTKHPRTYARLLNLGTLLYDAYVVTRDTKNIVFGLAVLRFGLKDPRDQDQE